MVKNYIPERGHIVWLDFEPTKGKEIGKYRPAFVLSSKAYHESTGLLICCPIISSIRGSKTEVLLTNLDKPSVVAASLIQTLSWQDRKVKFIVEAEPCIHEEVLYRILPLLGADKLFQDAI